MMTWLVRLQQPAEPAFQGNAFLRASVKVLSVSVVKITPENIHHKGAEVAPRHRENLTIPKENR
jgi:hypothetical protein